MLAPILRKECIKLRVFWLMALALNACVTAYVYIHMKSLFRMDHAEVVWYRVIHLGQTFYDALMFVPLVTGVFLATAQFFPEMKSQRFRIALHLPVSPHAIVMGHVLVGLGSVVAILLADLAALAAMTAAVFPAEMVARTVLTALPWLLAGPVGYLAATLVLLEPAWRLRVYNGLVGAGLAGLLLRTTMPGAYAHVLLPLAGLILLFTPSVLLPAYRFRYRRG